MDPDSGAASTTLPEASQVAVCNEGHEMYSIVTMEEQQADKITENSNDLVRMNQLSLERKELGEK